MPVPVRHVLRQGPNLGALVTAARIAWQSKGRSGGSFEPPGPVFERVVSPPPRDLIDDYVRHVGGQPSAYRGTVPAHLFPQWAFPLMSRTLEGLPYDVSKVLNAGCTLEQRHPLPDRGPWRVTARLASVDEDERRVLMAQRITTGTPSEPECVVATVRLILPKRRPKGAPKSPPATVPTGAREIASWQVDARAGLDFALLTGDFNPIHWIRPAARAAGFQSCILHGFSTLARAIEGLNQNLYAGRVDALASVDARFARPVVLPATIGLFLGDDRELFVGTAPGAPASLIGSWQVREDPT